METHLSSFTPNTRNRFRLLALITFAACTLAFLKAHPLEWMFAVDEADVPVQAGNQNIPASPEGSMQQAVALSCLPEVNVSLGQQGYAVITSIMLVNAPDYPPFQYDVDIMGPLNDTVYCDQLGLELMVVVTELPTGNSCMSTIFIEDKLPPVLSCTPDVLPCNTVISSINFEDYLDVATDNCDDDLNLIYQYTVQNLPCNPSGYTQQISVLWTAIDDSGNSTTCNDIIYLQKPPLSEIDFPADVTLNCVNPNIDPSNTGVPTYDGEPLSAACQFVVTHTDQTVPMCTGAQKIIRLWKVTDWCTGVMRTDAQEILLIDNVPPVLTCPASITIGTSPGVCTTKYTLPMPVVSDACASTSMIDIDIFVSGVPGIFSPGTMVNLGLGTTSITIRATDPCGNSSMCSYNVTVRDNTPPIPVCHSLTVGLGPDGMAFLVAATLDFPVIENCGILSKEISRMTDGCGQPDDLIPGPDVKFCCEDVGDTLMVVFKVTDLSGNMNTCMFEVIVKDLLPPVVQCEDLTISIENGGTIVIDPADVVLNADDNCFLVDTIVTPGIFECEDIGENIVIVTVVDESGNSSTCTATVTIVDEVPPVAECQDITVTLGPGGVIVITTDQIDNGSTDNCAIDTMFLNEYEFDCTEAGINIVTLTVVDEGGNTATCTATVTVLTTPPVALCQDITVELNESGVVVITADQVDNGSFDDCGIDTITVTPDTFTCDSLGVNTVVLTVTDLSGNVSTCSAFVTVVDSLPPTAVCQDITVMLDDNGMAVITATQINNGSTDNCSIVSLEIDSTQFDCEDAGPNVVTLTVTDQSGNSATCTAIVFILMPDPPVALCQDITVTLGPDGIVVVDAADIDSGSFAQCGEVMLTINQDTFDCTDLGENIVILTVTDETGAFSTCTATVLVEEAPPVAICQDITVSLIGNTVTITGAQVNNGSTDDCGIISLVVTPDTFTCDSLGPNLVTLTVTDQSGNTSTCTAIVTVTDITPPVAICQDITVTLNADGIVVLTGLEVNNGSTDNCFIDDFTATPDTLTCENLGDNEVILTVTDQSGNTSTCTATVTVNAEPPVASCQDITVSLDANGVVTITPGQVDDGSTSNCGNITLTLDEDTFDCTELGPNTVVLTVTDDAGNTATCSATVTVVDDLAPVCSAADITVFLDAAGNVTITAEQVNDGSTDNCDIITLTVTPDDFNCEDVGPNTVTLTVTDQSGNSSTCTATVTVVDTIAPFCATQNITVSLVGNIVTITAAQVNNGSNDICGPVTLDVTPATFDCDDLGPNEVVLTVTDESGNTSTCTAIVTVEESGGGLVANCQNVTIFLDANGNASVDPEDVNNGSGGGCEMDSLTFDLSQTDFNCTDLGPNIVTLTVTDEEGNTATCTAIVTVVDNIPPTIDCPDNVTVNCDEVINPNNTSQFGAATGNDNCPPVNITETAVFNLNDCNVGTIMRTFVASDGSGNTASCVQIVTIINTNPFTEDDITWPASPISINICNSTNPNDIPNGTPVFDPASLQCANPVATFADQVQTIIDNDPNTPCRIITRTWTVTDNCQVNGTWTFVQTINVIDVTPPNMPNISDMTKTANENCVAFFTLIASATDCAGVTITNNSPYGATTGANASGNYPIGQTTVIFTATDGCGNTSTMDVVITVLDPDPTEFLCEKVIVILPPETEITLCAEIFITFLPGTCTDNDDFIISYSRTNPYDTCRVFDCGDVGVTTFPLWFWNLSGTMLVDSCDNADLDLRDPDDNCQDGLVLTGHVESENGEPVTNVVVNVTNAPMQPSVTNGQGLYLIEGLNEGQGYEVAPYNDKDHKHGVSTLDLVLIQKHLLGLGKLNSPYKMIAADANKSGHISAFDILEIRKVILGINQKFPNNTSWRFVDHEYVFPDPYNPWHQVFAEFIWIDSVTTEITDADFIGIKTGDVNGSYFQRAASEKKIEPRSGKTFRIEGLISASTSDKHQFVLKVATGQPAVEGLQFAVETGGLSDQQVAQMGSGILRPDNWYYDGVTQQVKVSWSPGVEMDLSGKVLLQWPVDHVHDITLTSTELDNEAYFQDGGMIETGDITFENRVESAAGMLAYNLYQNKPNPFADGTVIGFTIPNTENVRLVVHDMAGREVFTHSGRFTAGYNEIPVRGRDLKATGIYYYTLYTETTSLTRKMSFTND